MGEAKITEKNIHKRGMPKSIDQSARNTQLKVKVYSKPGFVYAKDILTFSSSSAECWIGTYIVTIDSRHT